MGWISLHALIFWLISNFLPSAQEVALFVFIMGLICSNPWIRSQRLRALSHFLLGLLASSLIHILLYQSFTRLQFNFSQLVENPTEAWQSVIWFLGETKTALLIAEFLITAGIVARISLSIGRRFTKIFEKFSQNRPQKMILFLFTLLLLIPSVDQARNLVWGLANIHKTIVPRWMGDPTALPKTDESLIIVQLESLNGSVLFQEKNKTIEPAISLPGFGKLQDLGAIWYPYFWSTSFGTHFGMLNILCGTSGVTGNKLVPPPANYMCMPERFRRAGFDTSFYYSFTGPGFYSLLDTVNASGFENFLYGDKLMKKDDPFFQWGYGDCHFYRRALAHMKQKGLDRKKKIFVYLSVHMNHFPFQKRLDVPHPFSNPQNDKEKYLNSAYEQDSCLAEFVTEVEKLNRKDLNLLVVGDHSIPIEKEKGVFDGFTTSLFFLPSKQRKSEFQAGPRFDHRPSHDQIQNTVMELFGAPRSPASFLWSLKGEAKPAEYEVCHLITDLSPGTTFVTDGREIVQRALRTNRFSHLSLENNTPKEISGLRNMEEWSKVNLKPECLQRLGVQSATPWSFF